MTPYVKIDDYNSRTPLFILEWIKWNGIPLGWWSTVNRLQWYQNVLKWSQKMHLKSMGAAHDSW